MDKTLEKEAMKKILTNSIEKKTIIKKQIVLLQNFISSKAITISSKIDKESFEEIINSLLGEPLNKKLNTFTIAGLSSSTFIYSICSIVFNIILISIFQTVKNILVFNFSILLVYAFIVAIIMLLKKESN